jgi:hypothetical protein
MFSQKFKKIDIRNSFSVLILLLEYLHDFLIT